MRAKILTTAHVVRCARDVNQEKADKIRFALENRYPTNTSPEFIVRLVPLAVGAWLVVVRGGNHGETDTLACGSAELEIKDLFRTLKRLVNQWRANCQRPPE